MAATGKGPAAEKGPAEEVFEKVRHLHTKCEPMVNVFVSSRVLSACTKVMLPELFQNTFYSNEVRERQDWLFADKATGHCRHHGTTDTVLGITAL